VILFIAKTWFLWWMLAIVVAVRWFHLLSAKRMESADQSVSEAQEEEAYIVSWRILHDAQVVSLPKTENAY
jgi:hypothetical protein